MWKNRKASQRTNTFSKVPKEVSFWKSPGSGVTTRLILESKSSSLTKIVALRKDDKSAVVRVHPEGGALKTYPYTSLDSSAPSLVVIALAARAAEGKHGEMASRLKNWRASLRDKAFGWLVFAHIF